jgi:hypothetical protein
MKFLIDVGNFYIDIESFIGQVFKLLKYVIKRDLTHRLYLYCELPYLM